MAQTDWLRQQDSGIDPAGGGYTVATWLRFWHMTWIVKPDASPKYVAWIEQMIDTYLIPALGAIRLPDLSIEHLANFKAQLEQNLAPRSTHHILSILKRSLARAVKAGKLARNPMDALDLPRIDKVASKRPALSIAQTQQLLAAVADHRLTVLYELVTLYGFREGEVLGLHRTSLDLEHGWVTIEAEVLTVKGETKRHLRTKSTAGRRTLPLTPRLVRRLREHLARLADDRARAGEAWHEHGLVFPSEVGTPILPRNLLRHYHLLCITAGLVQVAPAERTPGKRSQPIDLRIIGKKPTFHGLRNTALTRLGEVAMPHVVKGIAGHAATDITEGYQQATMDEMRAALRAVEKKLGLIDDHERDRSWQA